MPESAVHEHVRQDLPRLEERRGRIEHGEVHHHEILVDERGYEDDYVDGDDILRYRRNGREEASSSTVIFIVFVSHCL